MKHELAFRVYVTDSLMAFGQGKMLDERYVDIINKKTVVDNRTKEEIVQDVIERGGLTVI